MVETCKAAKGGMWRIESDERIRFWVVCRSFRVPLSYGGVSADESSKRRAVIELLHCSRRQRCWCCLMMSISTGTCAVRQRERMRRRHLKRPTYESPVHTKRHSICNI